MGQKPVARPGGKDCVRYEFMYRAPHLGGETWGDTEFVAIGFPGGVGSSRNYGEYEACPAEQAADPELVALWRAWRKVRLDDSKTYWRYTEHSKTPTPDPRPRALVRNKPVKTRSIDGQLYRYEVYDAYFAGCEYWTVASPDYRCVAPK